MNTTLLWRFEITATDALITDYNMCNILDFNIQNVLTRTKYVCHFCILKCKIVHSSDIQIRLFHCERERLTSSSC